MSRVYFEAMADPIEIGVGSVLGETYQVVSLLGRGGMGTVWGAEHLRLPGKRVAVKVLHAAGASDESYARFRREAEIATRIGHPNIVDVLDWNTLPNGMPYLVLEFLDGESLASRLAAGPIPFEETALLLRQIGSALHAAHRAGIVHRDLKPDNIFLCPTDSGGHVAYRVKILDFGISKIRNSTTLQTQEARVLGTPQYMAPEQARGRNQEVDERTDVFALGAIVYEMLTGRPAFEGEDLASVVYKVVFEEPPPLTTLNPTVPRAAEAAVHRALSKERDRRQPDVLAFVAEVTGRPLDTLDRAAVRISKGTPVAFAPTEASLGGVVAHGTPRPALAAGAPVVPGAQPPPARRRSPIWLVLVGLLVVGGIGTTIAIFALGSPDPAGPTPPLPASGPRVAAVPPAPPPPPAPPGPTATGDLPATAPAVVPVVTPPDAGIAPPSYDAAVAPEVADAAPVPELLDAAVVPPPDAATPPLVPPRAKPPKPAPPPPDPSPPPAVRELVVRAEKALAERDYQTAIRLGNQSLMERKTPFGYSVIARAYCGLKDLGNAKAALQNVTGRERLRVYRRCAAMGFPLD
jgi:eukaryotic-like serine/threonine-protein kinase